MNIDPTPTLGLRRQPKLNVREDQLDRGIGTLKPSLPEFAVSSQRAVVGIADGLDQGSRSVHRTVENVPISTIFVREQGGGRVDMRIPNGAIPIRGSSPASCDRHGEGGHQ
jgi:hypothetical protein